MPVSQIRRQASHIMTVRVSLAGADNRQIDLRSLDLPSAVLFLNFLSRTWDLHMADLETRRILVARSIYYHTLLVNV